MPRVADHDARRRQVAEAVAALVADGGLDAVTVARTAAAAGISVGLVQHYFPSKDDMLLYAFTHTRGLIERRVELDAERADAAGARIEHILLEALTQLLPLDEARRREARVALAFTGRAVENPRLAEALRASNAHLRGRLAQAIRNGEECGEVPQGTDAEVEAARLLSAVDGLVLHLYADPAALSAEAALADHLARLFPGPCHHPQAE
jgi:AcrR family transcriptional regulator